MNWKNCLWFLENQNDSLENQEAYCVKGTGKIVFLFFQENVCSVGCLENQIDFFRRMIFLSPNRDAPIETLLFLTNKKLYINTRCTLSCFVFYYRMTRKLSEVFFSKLRVLQSS